MSDFVLTILGGVLVFVLGQIAVKFIIEPFQEYKGLVGEISASLILFANVGPGLQEYYLNSLEQLGESKTTKDEMYSKRLKTIIEKDWQMIDEAKRTFRHQASRLMETANKIPMYPLWALFRILPTRQAIIQASANLIGLSNSTQSDNKGSREKEIAKLLRIKILVERLGS